MEISDNMKEITYRRTYKSSYPERSWEWAEWQNFVYLQLNGDLILEFHLAVSLNISLNTPLYPHFPPYQEVWNKKLKRFKKLIHIRHPKYHETGSNNHSSGETEIFGEPRTWSWPALIWQLHEFKFLQRFTFPCHHYSSEELAQ